MSEVERIRREMRHDVDIAQNGMPKISHDFEER